MRKFGTILLLILLAGSARAQIMTGGYIAAEYIKSQKDGEFPDGTFANALAGITLTGQISGSVSFLAEFSLTQGNKIDINQAWAGLALADYANFRLGLYQVPFGQYNENNRPHQSPLICIPLHAAHLYPFSWRDVGVVAEGRISGFLFSAYLGNGKAQSVELSQGQQFQDNNRDKAWGGRLGLSLDQGFDAYYSLYNGKMDEENQNKLLLHAFNVIWMTGDFDITAEYVLARIDNPADFAQGEADGLLIQLAVNYRSLRPVISYQKLNYDDEFRLISRDLSRWTIGGILSLAETVFLKLEYDYEREGGTLLKNNILSCQIAVSF